MPTRSGIGALLCSAVLAAGCSSGGSKGASTPTTKPAGSGTSAGSKTDPTALARAAVLKLSDLPAGWTAKPHAPTDQSEAALNARIAACLRVPLDLVSTDRQPHVDSDDFTGPQDQQISSGVAVFKTAALPTEWIMLYSRPNARTCLARNVGNPLDPPRPSALTLNRVGNGAVAVRLTAKGIVVDALFARRGRALAYLAVIDPKGVDESALLAAMIERLPQSP